MANWWASSPRREFLDSTRMITAGLASIDSGGLVIANCIGGSQAVLGWERAPVIRGWKTRAAIRADLQVVGAMALAGLC